MTIEHDAITDPEIHEPKGASTATSNTTYVSDGAGSGSWLEPEPKGASTATAGMVYHADGAGSGTWVTPSYGGIYSHDSAIAVASIGTTIKKLEAFDADMVSNNITSAHASAQITVITTGDYMVNFQLTFATTASGYAGNYEFHLYIDGVDSGLFECHRDMSGSSDEGSCSFSGIASFTAAEVLTVYVASDSGADTDDIVVNSAQLSVHLLRAT
jgi:hypothetical protein